jgi:hypothetical protein
LQFLAPATDCVRTIAQLVRSHQRIVWIRVRQQRRNRQENARDGQRGAPGVLENVETDGAIGADVGMIHARDKGHLRRLERIVDRKVNVKEENAPFVGRVLGTNQRGRPGKEVVALAAGRDGLTATPKR